MLFVFIKKNVLGSNKAQNLGFLKCAGTTDSSFLLILLVFIKQPVLGVKKVSKC